MAVAIAVASYHWVEMPIRRGAFRPAQWRIAIPTIGLALVVAALVSTAGAVAPPDTSGIRFRPGPRDDVLLVGDSVANSLAPGLDDVGVKVGLAWSSGCRLIHGTVRFRNRLSDNCPWEDDWGRVLRRSHPKQVLLLSGVWDLFDVKPIGTTTFVAPGSPVWDRSFARQLERLVTMVESRHAPLTLLTIPCTGMLEGAPRAFLRGSYDLKRVRAANVVIRQVAARHPDTVKVVDLFSFLCPKGIFEYSVQGVGTRSDGVHLSAGGADLVARWLAPQLGLPVEPSR